MHVWPLSALILTSALTLGCVSKPTFTHEATPGVALDKVRAIALDARQDLVWMVPGKRTIHAPEYPQEVLRALAAKGYQVVDAAHAGLLVQVIVMLPERQTVAPPPQNNEGPPGRTGGKGGHTPQGSNVNLGGDLTVVVKVMTPDLRPAWFGSGTFPAPAKGPAQPQDSPEARMRSLLADYPVLVP